MTVNHHRHVPYLQLAQASYKNAIFNHDSAKILRNAVRIGLPSMALPAGERGTRDEGIIKLLLYFFRNIAIISPSSNLPVDRNGGEISRSATIEAFHNQDVLALLLTISSNMGDEFNAQDVIIMEILFHLLKGVNAEKLFTDKALQDAKNNDDLQFLLATEAGMHRTYVKNAPTRHNRFGTMIWVKRDDARHSTLSGQDVLSDQNALFKMDQSKKWNKPKQRGKGTEPAHDRFDLDVSLTENATMHLRGFVEEFLDSGFNPLFSHIRKAIEREADRVLETHSQEFFYLISWFLEAERARRRQKAEADKKKKSMDVFEADSFSVIASVLNQETFIALNRFMQDRLDMKSWREVQAGARCFTQILLIVQEMADSPIEEDQEIAENIQNRIFYEETTHDRVIAILRGYKDQGFGYLDSCTDLSHVFLRMLERYSRENADLQIRSRRRARVRRKAAAAQVGSSNQSDHDDSEAEDAAEAERVSKDRKFDFGRFAAKFMTQACVDTFVSFVKYYNDLNPEQLKRGHRFFYRVAFKQELSVFLFRLDIVALFNKMIKGPQGLNPTIPIFKEWDELVRQVFKKMFKKLHQRPELAVEMLFSKIHSSVFFLENGYEKQTVTSRSRAPAVLEVKGALTRDEQIGVAVAVLHENKIDAIDWVANILLSAANERQSWETEASARQLENANSQEVVKETAASSKPTSIGMLCQPFCLKMLNKSTAAIPDNEERRIAMFKDNKLRLLMTLAGFERLGIDDEPDATWIIPSALSASELHEIHQIIEKHRNNPIMEYGDEEPIRSEDMLRRAPTAKTHRAEYDDDSDGDGIVSDEEEFLFPAGGPTNKNRRSALEDLKKKRRRRRISANQEGGGLDDETVALKQEKRKLAELERRRKIKSEKFVRDIDDESDEEQDRAFFAREEERRKGQAAKVREAFEAGRVTTIVEGRKRKSLDVDEGKRKRSRLDLDLSDSDINAPYNDSSSPESRGVDVSVSSDEESSVTPSSSPRVYSSQEKSIPASRKPEPPKQKPRLVGRRLNSSQERIMDKASELTIDGGSEDMDETIKASQENIQADAMEKKVEQEEEEVETEDEDDEDDNLLAVPPRRRGVLLNDSDDD